MILFYESTTPFCRLDIVSVSFLHELSAESHHGFRCCLKKSFNCSILGMIDFSNQSCSCYCCQTRGSFLFLSRWPETPPLLSLNDSNWSGRTPTRLETISISETDVRECEQTCCSVKHDIHLRHLFPACIFFFSPSRVGGQTVRGQKELGRHVPRCLSARITLLF